MDDGSSSTEAFYSVVEKARRVHSSHNTQEGKVYLRVPSLKPVKALGTAGGGIEAMAIRVNRPRVLIALTYRERAKKAPE